MPCPRLAHPITGDIRQTFFAGLPTSFSQSSLDSYNPASSERILKRLAAVLGGFNRYSERLSQAGVEPSVGSTGDSYDNVLAETINGLYKAELVRKKGPWKTIEALEWETLNWVPWFNQQRLLGPIGHIPPAVFEALYERGQQESSEVA